MSAVPTAMATFIGPRPSPRTHRRIERRRLVQRLEGDHAACRVGGDPLLRRDHPDRRRLRQGCRSVVDGGQPERIDAVVAIGDTGPTLADACSAAPSGSRCRRLDEAVERRRGSPRPATPCCSHPAAPASTSTPTSRPAATIFARSSPAPRTTRPTPDPSRPNLTRESDHDRTAHRRRSSPRRARAPAGPAASARHHGHHAPPARRDGVRRRSTPSARVDGCGRRRSVAHAGRGPRPAPRRPGGAVAQRRISARRRARTTRSPAWSPCS